MLPKWIYRAVCIFEFAGYWMRFVCVLVMFAIAFDLPTTASTAAEPVAGRVDTKTGTGSPLIADCTETVIMPSPLSPRPRLRRATLSSKPTLRHRHRHHLRPHKHVKAKAKARARTHLKRKAIHHRRRPAPRPKAVPRAILHRVTYTSPLCAERSPVLNHMLGLPEYAVTQPPVPADRAAGDVLPTFIALPPFVGGGPGPVIGPVGPGPIVLWPPIPPIFPVGPGPVGPPPGPPVAPPVTPPVSSAPEPSSWAMMLMGMMLVGGSVRRRTPAKAA